MDTAGLTRSRSASRPREGDVLHSRARSRLRAVARLSRRRGKSQVLRDSAPPQTAQSPASSGGSAEAGRGGGGGKHLAGPCAQDPLPLPRCPANPPPSFTEKARRPAAWPRAEAESCELCQSDPVSGWQLPRNARQPQEAGGRTAPHTSSACCPHAPGAASHPEGMAKPALGTGPPGDRGCGGGCAGRARCANSTHQTTSEHPQHSRRVTGS